MSASRLISAAVVLILAVSAAVAHDHWINQKKLTDPVSGEWCCNENDCKAEKVTPVPGGYRTEAGDVVPYSRVIWKSQDGEWWRCHKWDNSTRCLIGPPPGS